MKYAALLLLAASLVSCGKPEEAPAPATQPPTAEPNVPAATAPAVASPPPAKPTAVPPVQPAAAGEPTIAPAKAAPAQAAVAAAPDAADLAHGQQIYRQACAFCHDKGVAGAPKTGDTAAWSPRLAQGADALLASALHGKGAMPAKGGNPSLSEADVRAAVDYLVAQSR